jgi:hypothetical protein
VAGGGGNVCRLEIEVDDQGGLLIAIARGTLAESAAELYCGQSVTVEGRLVIHRRREGGFSRQEMYVNAERVEGKAV